MNSRVLLTVVPCRNTKCEAVLSKCEGNWEDKATSGKSVVPVFGFKGLSLESCFERHYNAGVKKVSDILWHL